MKNLYIFGILLISFISSAQEDAWIYFTDKPESEFYLANPLEMLSQRSLDRRTTQNIPLDIMDVPIHQPYVDQVDAASGITVMSRSKWLNAVHVRGSQSSIAALGNLAFVQSIDYANHSLNASGRLAGQRQQRQARTAEAQVVFPYGNSANQIQMLNGHLLHQANYTGAGKIIAVMDAGFPGVDVIAPFQRLRDNNLILGGYNYVDQTPNVYTASSHGTMVLSTMGGYVANQLVGTAPDAGYLLYVTEDDGAENPVEESYWVEAAEAADSLGADVINTSLGYFAYDNPNYSYWYDDVNGVTSFISRGADIAFSRGMVVVVSAGNSGNSFNPNIAMPADAVNALTVGAVDAFENYVDFSSIGPTADGRIKPDVMAKGFEATVCMPSGNITTANGTSFSGPIMAGMVASFWQVLPDMPNTAVVQFIKQSADQFEFPTDQLGYGIPDFQLAMEMVLLNVTDNQQYAIKIYPNPVSDNLSVDLPDGTMSATMTIYNTLGQKLAEKTVFDNVSIPMSELQSGVYMYNISSVQGARTGRFIKR